MLIQTKDLWKFRGGKWQKKNGIGLGFKRWKNWGYEELRREEQPVLMTCDEEKTKVWTERVSKPVRRRENYSQVAMKAHVLNIGLIHKTKGLECQGRASCKLNSAVKRSHQNWLIESRKLLSVVWQFIQRDANHCHSLSQRCSL